MEPAFPEWNAALITGFGIGINLALLDCITGNYQINGWSFQIRKNWGVMVVMLLILLPIPFIFLHAVSSRLEPRAGCRFTGSTCLLLSRRFNTAQFTFLAGIVNRRI
jgi:hypothetical protein